jgi:hypothetical protein
VEEVDEWIFDEQNLSGGDEKASSTWSSSSSHLLFFKRNRSTYSRTERSFLIESVSLSMFVPYVYSDEASKVRRGKRF